ASESPFAPHPSSLTPEESAFAPQESAPTGDAGTASGQAPGGWAPPQHPSEPQPLWQTPEPQGQAHAEPVPQWQPPEVQEPLSLERESQTQAPYPQPEAQTQPEAHIEPEQAQAAGWATPQPTTAGWMPTHVVPTTGMDAWAVPDPTQPTIARLDPGVPVQVVETKGAWAHIVCSNTWSGWVDYRILVQLPR
ncbi:MAG TPA: SH3 domain-containing protein, partial [Candidatus Sulfotelmatobacter sp.]|nr:SH3 domain-containing protein [Candidatus Sulfotelmatobacter sp.]